MRAQTQVRIEGRTIVRSTLVLAATAVMGIAYQPAQKPIKPLIASREYVRVYGVGKSPVVQNICRQVRRRQLMDNVVAIRKQIRNKAEVLYRDENTKLVGITASQKTAIRSEKFMQNVVACKHIV